MNAQYRIGQVQVTILSYRIRRYLMIETSRYIAFYAVSLLILVVGPRVIRL